MTESNDRLQLPKLKPILNSDTKNTPTPTTLQAEDTPSQSPATEPATQPPATDSPVDISDEAMSSGSPADSLALNRLEEIASVIDAKKVQIVQNFFEIGHLLIEAKGHTDKGYGKWLPWLKQVGIHPRAAQMYMKIAQEFPNANSISHLGVAKAHALLALPEEERESFLSEEHLVRGIPKKVSEMSVNALKDAIKYRKVPTPDVPQEKESESAAEDKTEAKVDEGNAACPEDGATFDAQLESAQKALDYVYNYLFDHHDGLNLQKECVDALHSIHCTVNDCIKLIGPTKP